MFKFISYLFVLSFLTSSLGAYPAIYPNSGWIEPFKKKIASGERPEWMLKRIRKDLESFKGGVTKEQIDAIAKLSNLARYRIKNGVLHCSGGIEGDPIGNTIRLIHTMAPLPDLDLVMSKHDSFYHDWRLVSCKGPLFSFAKRISDEGIILFPDTPSILGYYDNFAELQKGKARYPWDKKENKAFWRGATSGYLPGLVVMNPTNFMQFPRCKLIKLSLDRPDYIDARFNFLVHIKDDMVHFLQRNKFVGQTASISDHLKYKYQILVDGFTCAFHRAWWQLFSDCATFKQNSNEIQWYYDELKPYVHYIPVEHDFSDLFQKFEWAKTHDDELKEMVKNANKFAESHITHADTMLYIYLLLLEYSKLMK